MAQVVKAGTKFFTGHGQDTNSHDGRKSLGEVLISTIKNIGGKLSNIIVGHFPDSESVKNLDVISMEADVETDNNNVVNNILDITGIAMASSDKESPAFPGAVRLAAVQCFAEETATTLEKGEKKKMTFDEVKSAVREMNIFPHQLYNEDAIKNDNVFGKLYEQINAKTVDIERLTKEKETIETKSKEALKKFQTMEAKGNLETMLSEGFTDKQKEYIINRFDPEKIEDLSEQGLKTFVENEKSQYAKDAKFFGVAEEQQTGKTPSGETRSTSDDPVEERIKSYGDK